MEYKEIIDKALKIIPELNEKYKEEKELYEEELSVYEFLGEILLPLIKKELKIFNNIELLDRISLFLNQMAESKDIEVKEALCYGILEIIGDKLELVDSAKRIIGDETKKQFIETEIFFGRKENIKKLINQD